MNPARILVVDDSLTIRRALEFILKPRGYALEFAADGRAALDHANSFQPDLVLLDYVLPDMRGPDVCSALAAIPSTAQTPVILVSAKGASIRQAYQDAQNVVSYITKPFKPQVVLSVVDNALARGRPIAPAREAAPTPPSEAAPATIALPSLRAATLEETFSALLGQLEDAVSAETRGEGPAARTLARLGDPLRRTRERLREIGQHLEEGGVAPYRLRPDGSFANIASTLLETHRLLCEATLALAAGGAPGPDLPHPPAAVLAVPHGHELHAGVARLAEGRDDLLLLDRELASLPWIVHLMQPRVLVVVPAANEDLDAAVGRLAARPPTQLALAPPGTSLEGDLWSGFEPIGDVAALATALGESDVAETDRSISIGLEVVTL